MTLILVNRRGEKFEVLFDEGDLSLIKSFHLRVSQKGGSKMYVQGHRRGDKSSNVKYLHRELVGASKGDVVDHINGNSLDNRRSNLRICTQSDNLKNRAKKSTSLSRFKGVDWVKRDKRWRARIGSRVVGYFASEIEAANAYNKAAQSNFGEYAKLNEI